VNEGGVGNFGGFKSSCSSNLIAADGVLNAPDYTRTCTCSYQNQTSLAFVHMPELEMWTRNDFVYRGGTLDRVGVNFGAPGDRRSSEGTLWLEYPSRGAPSPKAPIEVAGTVKYFQQNAARFSGRGLTWVASSGLEGEATVRVTLNRHGDPTLEDGLPIASSADDAEEDRRGKVRLDSSDLELVTDRDRQIVGLRFTDVAIPPGADIEEAYLQFSSEEKSDLPADLIVHGEDVDSSSPFTTGDRNLSGRVRTTASIDWKVAAWSKGVKERSPDISTIIAAIASRSGWKSGGAISLFVSGRGRRLARSFDGKAESAPRLVVRLSSGSAPPAAVGGTPTYTVRLHFAEPQDLPPGGRAFDVYLQGNKVLDGFDVAVAAGGPRRCVVKEFTGVTVPEALVVELKSVTSRAPILCGVEAVRE
jgi:hypothetical protein